MFPMLARGEREAEPLRIEDGQACVPNRPGIGLSWRPEAVEALSLGR